MKRFLLPVLLILFMFSYVSFAQTQMIDSFEATETDNTYKLLVEPPSTMVMSEDPSTKVDGNNSLKIKCVIAAGIHDWGSFAQLQKRVPSGQPLFNWLMNDTLSLWIKVVQPPVTPANVVFRIHIADQPITDGNIEEYIYENAVTLDAASDWFQIKAPLFERTADTGNPDNTGFILFPSSWGRSASIENNKVLDLDKIVGFNISFITTTSAVDSIVFNIDKFEATGMKAVPAIIFNGLVFPGYATTWVWGQSTLEVVPGAGAVTGSNAIKWTQGDEYKNGWTGWGIDVAPAFNLSGAWQKDTLKFKLKAEAGVGPLRAQFEDGTGKKGSVFTPVADNQWHEYALPLRAMTFQDNTTSFDSSNVTKFGIMAEASGVAGKVVYITDIWTGNPDFDVIAPLAATNVSAVAGTYSNVVTWTDVPGESGEKYDVYYSKEPITDVTLPSVGAVALDVFENNQVAEHLLIAPATDQPVTYYYAVVCKDAAGNISPVSASSAAVTNTAKGIVTVSINPPTSTFAADGNMQEWQSIAPIRMSPTDGTAFPAPNSLFSGAADLSVKAYLAVDQTYLYVAFDIDDDVVSTDVSTNDYENDCPDLFIGLYNLRGKPHNNYMRGATPDYHLRFSKNKVRNDGGGMAKGDSILLPGADYFWGEKFPTGYVIEARISLQDLAQRGPDTKFNPVEGFKIPLDFSINDADGKKREGILCYSPNNNDLSYSTPTRWMYTWLGNRWDPVGVDEQPVTANTYNLLQNYPNPFNPSTQITYSLKQPGFVTIKVYDMLGRQVANLVSENQEAGTHTVNFNASGLSSGMYIYKIDAGSFNSVKKMMLLK